MPVSSTPALLRTRTAHAPASAHAHALAPHTRYSTDTTASSDIKGDVLLKLVRRGPCGPRPARNAPRCRSAVGRLASVLHYATSDESYRTLESVCTADLQATLVTGVRLPHLVHDSAQMLIRLADFLMRLIIHYIHVVVHVIAARRQASILLMLIIPRLTRTGRCAAQAARRPVEAGASIESRPLRDGHHRHV
ncbi:hypothetical protein EVAR_62304_1 [Eumeta japonica]|uniref:Uncharacterized protein n=1 Tax=Eumeta variegata TaxID=151549 RepID=A0A4C1ZFE9_EUMVA|nr:hypothetical protein EVAR_62304_1 [Eumeta japonica]